MHKRQKDHFYSLLAMGNTGIGKSTFLNLISGSQKFKTSSDGKSCTKDISTHEFQFDDIFMESFDSPGLNDSEGEDQENMDKVTNFLRNYEHGLNAVAILISFSDHRLDSNLQRSIKYLYNFFGDGNFWFHVCIIVTHCPPYQEDIDEAKRSMTTGEYSLHSVMQQMIKDVCNLDKEPDIPFFFFDSMHPNYPPTVDSLPQFKNWIKSRDVFKTQDMEIKDVYWQYQEVRHDIKSTDGPKKPIYKLVPGEPKMITVDEDVPYVVKELKMHDVYRDVEEWVTRKWDAIDICILGIPRIFRDNKVKKTVRKKFQEPRYEDVLKYRKEKRTIFSGEFGENQKELKGYYQEKTSITESYTACWSYDCNPNDIKNKINPVKKDSTFSEPEITTTYFDKNCNILDPTTQSNKIEELKLLF